MVQARKYRSQGSGGGFSPINIGFGSVQRLEEQNNRLESTLSRNQKLEQAERTAFLNHIKGNQNLEEQNRQEIFDFEEKSRAKVADAQFRNSEQAVRDAQNEYKAITENGTVLSQLAEFSQTLGKTIGEVKQSVQKKNYEDQYYKTFTELTTGDVMATRAAEANLNKTSQEFSKAAQAAEDAGVPFEYARQLERLGGSRKIAAAKALAEVTASRFPLMLSQRLTEDDQTVITYTDKFTGEEKQITPKQATTSSEVLAVSQAILKDTLGQTGLTGVQPALIAPFLREMNNETVKQATQAQRREKAAYEQQQLENFDNDVRTEAKGNGLTPFGIKQLADRYTTLKDPKTGLNYTNKEARTYLFTLLQNMAGTDDKVFEQMKALAASPGPKGIAPKGMTYGEFYEELNTAIDNVYRIRANKNELQDDLQKEELNKKVQELAASYDANPVSAQKLKEYRDDLKASDLNYVPPQLIALIEKAERNELGVPQLLAEAQGLADNNELTSEKLKDYPEEIRNNPILQQKAKLGDAVKSLSAPDRPQSKSLNGNVTQIYKSLVADPSLTTADGLNQFAVKQYIKADLLDRAQALMISNPNMSGEDAIQQASADLAQLIEQQTIGVDPDGNRILKDTSLPYYYNTKTGRFPQIQGAKQYTPIDNFRRIEDQANIYLKTPEDLSNHVFIPEDILKSMRSDDSPIHPIVPYLRDKLGKKGHQLTVFDVLNAQLRQAGLPERKLPQAQVTFEAQNPTPQQRELLNYLPTAKRTTRASLDMGMNANTEREAVRHIATRLGIDPLDMAAIIDFETANALTSGAYRSGLDQWGGVNMDGSGRGSFLGWIQFSPDNQRQFDVKTGLTAMQHAEKVVQYLTVNGVRPGDPLHVIYQAIQAPAYVQKARATGRAYSADINGSVASHVNSIRQRRDKVNNWFSSGNVNPYADPRMQSSSSDPYDNI